MLRAYPAHLYEVYVVIVYMQSLVSSLCKSELSKITLLLLSVFTINNAENYNTIILDNSLLQSDDTRGCIYTITTWTS